MAWECGVEERVEMKPGGRGISAERRGAMAWV
jgi:hypothetical protein